MTCTAESGSDEPIAALRRTRHDPLMKKDPVAPTPTSIICPIPRPTDRRG